MTVVKVASKCAGLVKVTVAVDKHGNLTVTIEPIT